VLEISSPGVDRPIARSRDFERFKGETVAVQGKQALRDKATRLEGELLGLVDVKGASEVVLLRLPDGEEVSIPREAIRNVRLVFTWK
jgi:ribosome maturation factor RimP